MSAQPRSLLLPEHLAMIRKGVSCIVSSCDAALKPSMMRAVGSAIDDHGCQLTVYLARRQSRQLLQDIAATGRVAVVFSEPTTNRAVQVKASWAHTRSAQASDAEVLQRYLAAMEKEIEAIGFPRQLVQAMLAHRLEDVVAVSFEPEVAFDQTPGPKAGQVVALPSERVA